jgi:hemoglobin/transferrin/lactoferrin receptor protein
MRYSILHISLLLAITTLSSNVLAKPKDPDPAQTLDAVQVTATRRAETSTEVPQAVTIVSEKELRRRSGQTNADLLHGDIGTFVQQTTPGQAVIIVRGLKGSEVLHLVDGFRLNNAFFRNAPNQYPALVDPLMLEQIEVVRGPSSVLYGSDAMGGVVQMLSRTPRYSNADDGAWQNSGRVRTRYASADSSSISRAEYAGSSERLSVQAGATYQDVNLLRVGGDGKVLPFTAYSARFADAKIGFLPAEGHELIASLQYARQPKTPRFDELVPGFGQTNPTSVEFLFKPQERYFAQLVYRFDLETALFEHGSINLGRQDIVDDRENRDFNTFNRDTESNRSELIGLTAQFEKSLGTHFLTYGIERYQDEVSSTRTRVNIATNVVSARPSRYPDGSSMDSTGIFIADDWRATDVLDISAGLRYSRFDIELPPVINATGVKLDPRKVTGNLGFNFLLSDGVRLVGNYGRGFRAPNVFDLGTFGTRPGNRFNIPNPELKPETVDTIDFGVKLQRGAWLGELIAYKSRFKDKITSLETGARTATNQIIVQSSNATRLDLHGVEAGIRYLSEGPWNAYASATLTRGTEKFAGLSFDADRIPPLFGRIGADYRVNGVWTLSAYSFFAARQDRLSPRDLTDPRINPKGTAGYATANIAASWNVLPELDLRLSAENLGDRKYREHGTGLDEAGRSFGVAFDWRF